MECLKGQCAVGLINDSGRLPEVQMLANSISFLQVRSNKHLNLFMHLGHSSVDNVVTARDNVARLEVLN